MAKSRYYSLINGVNYLLFKVQRLRFKVDFLLGAVSKVFFTAKYAKKTQRSQNTDTFIPAICVLCDKLCALLYKKLLKPNTSC